MKLLLAFLVSIGLIAGLWMASNTKKTVAQPEYPDLRNNPDPSITGTVAYAALDTDGVRCLWVVPASGGERRKVTCGLEAGSFDWQFSRDGHVVVRQTAVVSGRDIDAFRVYDILTNLTVAEFTGARNPLDLGTFSDTRQVLYTDSGPQGASKTPAQTDDPHTTWVATDPDGKNRLLEKRVPGNYAIDSASRSPDGQWILLTDTAASVLILDLRGNVRKLFGQAPDSRYIWVGSGGITPRWYQPGNDKGTVDVEALRRNTMSGVK